MATDNKSSKKRKQRYLPHNKPVKQGAYPLHPGVQGFFITCEGGKERQASHEAINVIDSVFDIGLHHWVFPMVREKKVGTCTSILGNNQIEDVRWLCSLSESELDMLIMLKTLVLQRAKELAMLLWPRNLT